MTVLSTLDFDGLTDGATVSPAAPWTTAGTAYTARTAAGAHGGMGARAEAISSGAQLIYDETSGTTATRCQSYYFRLVDHPGASYFGALIDGGTNRADWRINADLTVSIRNAFTAVASSTATLSTGTLYRSEWLTSTSGQELRIYEGDNTTPVITLTGALTNAQHTRVNFGVTASGSGRTFEVDTLRVADDWTGPLTPPTPEPTSIWRLVTGPGTSTPLGDPVIVDGGAEPQPLSDLGFIGDSLTFQGGDGAGGKVHQSLVAHGWDTGSLRVDGLIGRSIAGLHGGGQSTLQVIQSWRTSGFDPDKWVIALGSNNIGGTNGQWTNDINTVLNEIASGSNGPYQVHWVGITFRPDVNDTRSTRFVTVMGEVAASRSDLTVIPVDFNTLFHNGRSETGLWLDNANDSSGRHMTPAGYAVRNEIVSTAVTP